MINIYETVKLKPLTETVHIKDISDEVYFSKEYSNYISNSRLKLIDPTDGGTPNKFFEGLGNNKLYSDALIFGSAVHELTLQPDSFILTEIDRPTAKAGFMADYIWENYIGPCGDNAGEMIAALTDDVFIEASDEIDYYKGKMNEDKDALTFYANMTNLITHQEKDMVQQYIPLDINGFEDLQSYLNKVDE